MIGIAALSREEREENHQDLCILNLQGFWFSFFEGFCMYLLMINNV